jgi:hypothetical protein
MIIRMNDRITISITPELSSALTRLALINDTNVSRQIEVYLRENSSVNKMIQEIRRESDDHGAYAGNPEKQPYAKAKTIISSP